MKGLGYNAYRAVYRRQAKGNAQTRFANPTAASRQIRHGVTTIIRIERNQVEPQARTIRKLAETLGVEPHKLLKGEDDG